MFIKKEEYRPKAYIVGGGLDYIRLLFSLGCDGAKGLDDADFVVFTGGEDVNPELYGEIPMAKTHFNRYRDDKEIAVYRGAIDRELPMVGICRGGQFLNVMNGGKMWQHVNGHTQSHPARIETPPFNSDGKRRTIMVTSTHHQMMRPAEHAIVLMIADVATEKNSVEKTIMGKMEDDAEVVFYDDSHCLCFQPHPELRYAGPELVDYFEECLDNYIYPRIPLRATNATEQAIIDQVPAKDNKKAAAPVSSKKKEK
jgi:gamma-glutamyl-gamma-aminobutyrate hydrolase PuuD